MATRLFLHNALFDTTTYPGSYPDATGELQADVPGTPAVTFNKEDAITVNRSMSKAKGSSQIGMTWSATATTNTQMNYITKFISEPLKDISSITSQQWTSAFAHSQSNANANNTGVVFGLFVWRPSTNALVGEIYPYTGSGGFGTEPNAINTAKLFKGNLTAGNSTLVSGIQDGDVIVIEIYSRHQQSSSSAYVIGFYLDGNNEHDASANNTTVTDLAAYIETPQDLTFVTDIPQELEATSNYKDILKQRPQQLITNSI